jgi:hypothetical protein
MEKKLFDALVSSMDEMVAIESGHVEPVPDHVHRHVLFIRKHAGMKLVECRVNELGLTRTETQMVRLCDLIFNLFIGIELNYQEALRMFKHRRGDVKPSHSFDKLLKEAKEINRRIAQGHLLPVYQIWPHSKQTDFVALVRMHQCALTNITEERYDELKRERCKCRKLQNIYFKYAFNVRTQGELFHSQGY